MGCIWALQAQQRPVCEGAGQAAQGSRQPCQGGHGLGGRAGQGLCKWFAGLSSVYLAEMDSGAEGSLFVKEMGAAGVKVCTTWWRVFACGGLFEWFHFRFIQDVL